MTWACLLLPVFFLPGTSFRRFLWMAPGSCPGGALGLQQGAEVRELAELAGFGSRK